MYATIEYLLVGLERDANMLMETGEVRTIRVILWEMNVERQLQGLPKILGFTWCIQAARPLHYIY